MMQKIQEYPWQEPLEAAATLANEPTVALLYSGLCEQGSGRYSFLAWGVRDRIETNRWADIEVKLSEDLPWYENAWFGWLGYGMRCDSELLPRRADAFVALPDTCLWKFQNILRFDHEANKVEHYSCHLGDIFCHPKRHYGSPGNFSLQGEGLGCVLNDKVEVQSNFSKCAYLQSVRDTLSEIEAGNFYQANLTRKFFGTFTQAPDSFGLFTQLAHISPATYSAYFRDGARAVISSSPESFLRVAADGHMVSRPIKGSAPRGATPEQDANIAASLRGSTKDRAENRMIVDLVRNDMARAAISGSVRVTTESALHSYATVHHLISAIEAQKRPDISTLRTVEACFPPGSMTGAPKIAAMRWCTTQEPHERGVYSGALGWFGGDGSCALSVVIRTLLLDGMRFEFQVGGGIVADSTPEGEWRETLVKARGIAKLLGIAEEKLEAL